MGTTPTEEIAAAARTLVGARFRPQGHDVALGLDCVGVVVASLAGAGCVVRAPHDYWQRGGDPARIAAMIGTAGLARIGAAAAGPGDVLLLEVGPAQLHLAVLTETGFVHADAGLRKVVETPGRPRWPVLGAWRAVEGNG